MFIYERRISKRKKIRKVVCRKVIRSFLNVSTRLHCSVFKFRESKKFTCNSKQNLLSFKWLYWKIKLFASLHDHVNLATKTSFGFTIFFISKKLNHQNYSNSKVQKGKQFLQWVTTPCTTQQPITANVGPPVCCFGLSFKCQIREHGGPTKVQINLILIL